MFLKNPSRVAMGMELPRIFRKCGNCSQISKDDQENIKWNFHGPWFLILEIPMCLTQFCKISRGREWGFILLSVISMGKAANQKKFQWSFSKRYLCPQPLCVEGRLSLFYLCFNLSIVWPPSQFNTSTLINYENLSFSLFPRSQVPRQPKTQK